MEKSRLGPETKAIIEAIKELNATVKAVDHPEGLAGNYLGAIWTMERIGNTDIYKVYITAAPNGIVMTGANVTTQISFPFPHKWESILFYHTTVAFVASTDALTIILRRSAGAMTPERFSEDLLNDVGVVASRRTENFGDPFKREAGAYDLILNTTATDLIFPVFYVQKLEA
jgi:hypothetical protein